MLGVRPVFGDLATVPGFAEALQEALEDLDRDGVRSAIAARLTGGGRGPRR
jgi:hypothetical protein